jgi:hypothetical protein
MSSSKLTSYFKIVSPKVNTTTMSDSQTLGDQGTYANYTWYQRLIQGSASRVSRYREYDMMDNDVEIARALDTIAEEMVGNATNQILPMRLIVNDEKVANITSSDVMTLKTALRYWCDIHDWDQRLFNLCRTTVKYGDCFFIRNKETSKWTYIHPKDVVAAIVDEEDATKVMGWQVRKDSRVPNSPYNQPGSQYGYNQQQDVVDTLPADRVIRFTLNDDMSESAPFGESVLRAVYRAQKQKELLQDAIIIYRIQRAPERRVFYIDVGKMPPQRSKAYLEQVKNEIRQKKIPSYGGGVDQVDSVYNPQSMQEDFFFAQRPDGRGSRVETLPGGQGLGELSDLEFFQEQVFRGLRIPTSYMKESDGALINDGKTGIAYIQELRFALYINRLQRHVSHTLNVEFKKFIRSAGIRVDPASFDLALYDPENFGVYRQQQLDSDLLNTYQAADGISHLAKRFTMRKYLQLTAEEIKMNERMKMEEMGMNPDDPNPDLSLIYGQPADGGMGALGGMGADAGMVAGMGGSQPIDGIADMNPEMGTATQPAGNVPPTQPAN